MKTFIINSGSVQDIRTSVKNSEQNNVSAEQFQFEIDSEKKGLNRKTVIQMLTAALNRKIKSDGNHSNSGRSNK